MRLWLILILPLACNAVESGGANAVDAEDAPSMELLQFLGEWETHEGKWVDPVAFGALTQAAEEVGARPEEEQDHAPE